MLISVNQWQKVYVIWAILRILPPAQFRPSLPPLCPGQIGAVPTHSPGAIPAVNNPLHPLLLVIRASSLIRNSSLIIREFRLPCRQRNSRPTVFKNARNLAWFTMAGIQVTLRRARSGSTAVALEGLCVYNSGSYRSTTAKHSDSQSSSECLTVPP